MRRIVVILNLLLSICSQSIAQEKKDILKDAPTEEFLKFRKEVRMYHVVEEFKCSENSIIPYFLYEQSGDDWQGCMLAVPKEEMHYSQIKYQGIGVVLLDHFYDILFDKDKLVEDYDLYEFYLSREQLTDVNDIGNVMYQMSDTGEIFIELLEREDAIATVLHYENGEWVYYDKVETKGTCKFRAKEFANEIMKERFK